ncbi:VOC family metalloprotein YjdN [Yokenella regensburgei]|uniref:VOC family metalloprotein YjdN n=1 Tax=Yokenella regensburgei TaxID=158877 RepID=UPI0031DDEE60
MSLTPYLFFSGNCAQAIAFYQDALCAELLSKLTRGEMSADNHTDSGEGCAPDLSQDSIVNARLLIAGQEIMVSDGVETPTSFSGFSLSLSPSTLEEGKRWFDALSAGAEIKMSWQETFWAYGFGMLTDKFGVPWMVSFNKPH